MVSELFRRDYRRMKAEGVDLTLDEIIRLNALAVRAKLAARPFVAAHLPRVVFLEGFTLREPTVAHELWVERVAEYVDIRKNINFRIVYAYALSRAAEDLPNPNRHRRTIRKIFGFARRHALAMTSDQLADAIDYALMGADWKSGELPPKKERKRGEAAADPYSPMVGVIVRAKAERIPITLDEAKRMTPSEVLEVVERAEFADGSGDEAKNQALGDYFTARDEIRKRASKDEL